MRTHIRASEHKSLQHFLLIRAAAHTGTRGRFKDWTVLLCLNRLTLKCQSVRGKQTHIFKKYKIFFFHRATIDVFEDERTKAKLPLCQVASATFGKVEPPVMSSPTGSARRLNTSPYFHLPSAHKLAVVLRAATTKAMRRARKESTRRRHNIQAMTESAHFQNTAGCCGWDVNSGN